MKRHKVVECAYEAQVDPETVRRWIRAGKLKAETASIGNSRYEITEEEWSRFCDDNGIERKV